MTIDLGRVRAGTEPAGDLTIGFRETGTPSGTPVVLLHGLGSKAATWDLFAAELAEDSGWAIALDARGHGASSWPGEYSLDLMVGDLLAFLDRRGFDRVDLVGHSMGGGVAQLFAGSHPRRVRRLVIEEAAPPARTPPAEPASEPPAEAPGPVDFDWRLVRPVYRGLRTPDPDWWALLASIAAPTLLVAGGPASHLSRERIQETAAAIPDARMVEIEVGHHVHREAPAAFAEAVLDFLR
ncbi:alpha/beta fold hydrolase [Amycolatopsis nigrescens]|uniref:alpha/beta fold hydrolase n=1 Tax=Amycolatopsis nigrescens TaxID=381445 RepID=UPI00036CE2D8|nr:alpha/beta hydrolase [Amycolatopsis nigrescens]